MNTELQIDSWRRFWARRSMLALRAIYKQGQVTVIGVVRFRLKMRDSVLPRNVPECPLESAVHRVLTNRQTSATVSRYHHK